MHQKLIKQNQNQSLKESIAEGVKKNEKDNLSETPKQKNFNDFLEKIKEEQKNIDIISFKNVFNYETPDKMLKY